MVVQDIKPIVKGIAELQYVMGGGVAIYHITSVDGKKYQLEIIKRITKRSVVYYFICMVKWFAWKVYSTEYADIY